jgi:hypothetical protein
MFISQSWVLSNAFDDISSRQTVPGEIVSQISNRGLHLTHIWPKSSPIQVNPWHFKCNSTDNHFSDCRCSFSVPVWSSVNASDDISILDKRCWWSVSGFPAAPFWPYLAPNRPKQAKSVKQAFQIQLLRNKLIFKWLSMFILSHYLEFYQMHWWHFISTSGAW